MAIRRLHLLHGREERERTGLFLIEGVRFLLAADRRKVRCETLVVAPDLLHHRMARQTVRRWQSAGVPVLEVPPGVFHHLSGSDEPQGIAAAVPVQWERLAEVSPHDGLCWIVLGSIQSPGNLGSILRTADAVGAAGIVFLDPDVDPYDPACVRASMGALFSLRLVRASPAELLAWKRRHSVFLVGTAPDAAADYQEIRYPAPTAIWMGWERRGIPSEHRAFCDTLVRIPMRGDGDSLNVAVATGVALYEVLNQDRRRPG